MSVITAIYDLLSTDEQLRQLLAEHTLAPGYPAIYERWAIEDIPMPYLILNWGFTTGEALTKTNGTVTIDVFTAGTSSIQAETIRDRVLALVVGRKIFTREEGPVRLSYLRDGSIPEPEANVVHWMIEVQAVYWNQTLIGILHERNE